MRVILSKTMLTLMMISCMMLFSACSTIEEKREQVDIEEEETSFEKNEITTNGSRLSTEKIDVPKSRLQTSKIEGKSTFYSSKIDGSSNIDREIIETLTEFNAEEVDEGTRLTLPENILFDFDSADLRSDADGAIEKLVRLTEETDEAITIIGHTDSRGEDDYNQRLSENRAEAVRQALVESQVDEKRLKAEGKGATEPVAENTHEDGSDHPEGRQQNRRVEIIIHGFNTK